MAINNMKLSCSAEKYTLKPEERMYPSNSDEIERCPPPPPKAFQIILTTDSLGLSQATYFASI
jgi:hypothetical protein